MPFSKHYFSWSFFFGICQCKYAYLNVFPLGSANIKILYNIFFHPIWMGGGVKLISQIFIFFQKLLWIISIANATFWWEKFLWRSLFVSGWACVEHVWWLSWSFLFSLSKVSKHQILFVWYMHKINNLKKFVCCIVFCFWFTFSRTYIYLCLHVRCRL